MTIDWNKQYNDTNDYRPLKTLDITKILNYMSTPQTSYIDLGCGTGQLTREFFHRGFTEIYGVDGSESAIKIARTATGQAITYIQHDLSTDFTQSLSIKFDLITCKYTLAFIENQDIFIQRTASLLKNGGLFVLISPHRPAYPERPNITLDEDATKALLQRYFSLIDYFVDANSAEYYICKQIA